MSNPERARKHAREFEQALTNLPPGNSPLIKGFLERKRLQGKKPATIRHYAHWLSRLARHIGDRPLTSIRLDELTRFFGSLVETGSLSTAYLAGVTIRSFFSQALPKKRFAEVGPCCRVGKKGFKKDLRVITVGERDILLGAAKTVQEVALLWVLWDTGMRANEVVSLNVSSVEFDEKGGARLRLPVDADRLKTGSRTVYVVECVPSLRQLLATHPQVDDPAAPLFLTSRGRRFLRRLQSTTLNSMLIRLSQRTKSRRFNPHLFRHTRATRMARDGWPESKMRAYMGWSARSNEPSTYIHLVAGDLEAQIRKDAIAPSPATNSVGPSVAPDTTATLAATVAAAVAAAMQQLQRNSPGPPAAKEARAEHAETRPPNGRASAQL